jgi:hypothetical protein
MAASPRWQIALELDGPIVMAQTAMPKGLTGINGVTYDPFSIGNADHWMSARNQPDRQEKSGDYHEQIRHHG